MTISIIDLYDLGLEFSSSLLCKIMKRIAQRAVCLFYVLSMIVPTVFAQAAKDELAAMNEPPPRLRSVIEKFSQDGGAFNRLYTAQTSSNRAERFRQLYAEYAASLAGMNFDLLNNDEQVDYILFANHLRRETRELDREKVQFEEMAAILPFARTISDLEDQRRRLESIDPGKTAALLDALAGQIAETQKNIDGVAADLSSYKAYFLATF